MRWTSTLVEKAGGRIGGYVAMMNRAGLCMRMWVQPSNPNSSAQQGVRATLATLAYDWSHTLTQDKRDAWAAYAATLTFTNKLGVQYTIGGFDAFVAANAARMVGGLSQINDGPVVGGFATYSSPTIVPTVSGNKLVVTFVNTDDWAGEVGGAMLFRVSPIGFNAGITFYEGPYVYGGKIVGAGTPPSSPANVTITVPTFVAGTQYGIAVRVVRADGRFSQQANFRALGV